MTNGGLKFLSEHGREPFFLFLHYFDPHYEYRHHEGWSLSAAYSGWLRREGVDFDNLEQKRHLLDADDLAYLRDLYDDLIHVPMMMVLPGAEHRRKVVSEIVETREIFPTIPVTSEFAIAAPTPPPACFR